MSSSKHWRARAYSLYGSPHVVIIKTAEVSIMIQIFQKNKSRPMGLSVMGQGLEEL